MVSGIYARVVLIIVVIALWLSRFTARHIGTAIKKIAVIFVFINTIRTTTADVTNKLGRISVNATSHIHFRNGPLFFEKTVIST